MLNYSGLDGIDAEIKIFFNGVEAASEIIGYSRNSAGYGRIVLGGPFYRGQDYVGVQIDELIYFNQSLNDQDVQSLYTAL